MILVQQIRLPLSAPSEQAIFDALRRLNLVAGANVKAQVHRVSVDARRRPPILVYTVAVQLESAAAEANTLRGKRDVQLANPEAFVLERGQQQLPGPVVVCGLGPAGLFCALELAAAGYTPLVLERGPNMEARRHAVDVFEAGGCFDPEANIQFGEGGAGTFSDGKLTTRIKDPLCARVTQRLLAAGAPAEIAFTARPHIGTDLLQGVLTRLRQELESLGGRVLFNTRLTGVESTGGHIKAVQTSAGTLPCGALVLAVGHSARDVFSLLPGAGVPLVAKPFSVGFRIEHLQSEVDRGLYHEAVGHPALPPGEYQLSTHIDGRGVYTFCMCPGGNVVAAASEEGAVVTNGMSRHSRDGSNANAAVVAGVNPGDFGEDPAEAVAFQRELEQAAYAAAGGGFAAPAETVGSFLQGSGLLQLDRVQPTYPRGVQPASLGALLPNHLTKALRAGLQDFGRKLPGFDAPDAVLTGLETRTSCPLRIPRGESLESTNLGGLWPCGEGAGYAGGIMSAAVDGLRTAQALAARYAPLKASG